MRALWFHVFDLLVFSDYGFCEILVFSLDLLMFEAFAVKFPLHLCNFMAESAEYCKLKLHFLSVFFFEKKKGRAYG